MIKFPALSFSVFKEKLLSGMKCQTIRKVRVTPINVGDKLYIYWQQRSKNSELLGVSECTWTRTTLLKDVTYEEAILDGFDGILALWDWFNKHYSLHDTLKGQWQIIKFKPLNTNNKKTPLRVCSLCDKEANTPIDLSQFKYNKRSKFKRQNICKQCDAKTTKKWQQNNKDHYLKVKKKWRINNKSVVRINKKNWKKRYPKKVRAEKLAQKHTILEKNCADCGKSIDLERHHPNYDKPLTIITLCKECHTLRHWRN